MEKKKGTRTVSRQLHSLAFPGCFLADPGLETSIAAPNLSGVCSCQASLPNGWVRATGRYKLRLEHPSTPRRHKSSVCRSAASTSAMSGIVPITEWMAFLQHGCKIIRHDYRIGQ